MGGGDGGGGMGGGQNPQLLEWGVLTQNPQLFELCSLETSIQKLDIMIISPR